MEFLSSIFTIYALTLLHSERPKLYTILAFLSAVGLNFHFFSVLQSDSPQIDVQDDSFGGQQQEELLIDECFDNPCQNQGTCSSELFGFECLCGPGYTGIVIMYHFGEFPGPKLTL